MAAFSPSPVHCRTPSLRASFGETRCPLSRPSQRLLGTFANGNQGQQAIADGAGRYGAKVAAVKTSTIERGCHPNIASLRQIASRPPRNQLSATCVGLDGRGVWNRCSINGYSALRDIDDIAGPRNHRLKQRSGTVTTVSGGTITPDDCKLGIRVCRAEFHQGRIRVRGRDINADWQRWRCIDPKTSDVE